MCAYGFNLPNIEIESPNFSLVHHTQNYLSIHLFAKSRVCFSVLEFTAIFMRLYMQMKWKEHTEIHKNNKTLLEREEMN